MAANFYKKLLKKRQAVYYQLKDITSKLQRTASSIGFIKCCLHRGITPKFATVNGQFCNTNEQRKAEKRIMRSYLNRHYRTLREFSDDTEILLIKSNKKWDVCRLC